MTREEQINLYLKERNIPITSLEANLIIEGIEWADEHPNLSEEEQVGMSGLGLTWQKKHLIEKSCNWLSLNMTDIVYWGMNGNLHKPEFIQNFKRAMEE